MDQFRRLARSDGGAAAVEFAFIVWALIFVCLGIIEFGRGFHTRNEMTYAADLAARRILTFTEFSRQELSAASEQKLVDEIRAAFTGNRPDDLVVTFTDSADDTFRTVLLQYPFSFVIPQLGDAFTLSVTRRIPIG